MKTGLSRLALEKAPQQWEQIAIPWLPFMIHVDRDSNEVTEQRGGTATVIMPSSGLPSRKLRDAEDLYRRCVLHEASAMVSSYLTKAATPGAATIRCNYDVWSADRSYGLIHPSNCFQLATVLKLIGGRRPLFAALYGVRRNGFVRSSVSDESARYGAGKSQGGSRCASSM